MENERRHLLYADQRGGNGERPNLALLRAAATDTAAGGAVRHGRVRPLGPRPALPPGLAALASQAWIRSWQGQIRRR